MVGSDEGLTSLWAERRAAPKAAHIPSGDRPMYASGEGLTSSPPNLGGVVDIPVRRDRGLRIKR